MFCGCYYAFIFVMPIEKSAASVNGFRAWFIASYRRNYFIFNYLTVCDCCRKIVLSKWLKNATFVYINLIISLYNFNLYVDCHAQQVQHYNVPYTSQMKQYINNNKFYVPIHLNSTTAVIFLSLVLSVDFCVHFKQVLFSVFTLLFGSVCVFLCWFTRHRTEPFFFGIGAINICCW